MKILLVRPGYQNLLSTINIVNVEPLELEYLFTLATGLGFQCKIHDAVTQRRKFAEVIADYNPDIVAITGYITQKNLMLEYAERAKQFNPAILVIMGGVHAELNFQNFYRPVVDFIVHSGGIHPFGEILKYYAVDGGSGSTQAAGHIKGICYRTKENQWFFNEKAYIDPNSLPIPDRGFFYENRDHFKYITLSPCATVKTSYSCPHKCNFCYCCQLNGGNYVCRDVDKVIEEIAGIDCENIWILDDTFYVDRQRVQEFVRLAKETGLRKNFIIYYRADFVATNEDIIVMLKGAGLKVVLVGLEAFDDKRLKDYDKRTTSKVNEECIRILNKHNIECTGLFIVDIDATKEDFQTLRQYVKKHQLVISTAAILTPLPGTYQYEKYRHRIISSNPKDWDFLHLVAEPGNLSKHRFYIEFYKFYLKLLFMNKKNSTLNVSYLQHIGQLAKAYIKKLVRQ